MTEPLVDCRALRKVFRTHQRDPGLRGLARSFLRRRYVDHVALDGVDLVVRPGEMVGLIGANGAGKTTLVKCATGIVPVSAGSARLLGRDSFSLTDREKRRLALVMGQRSALWWDLPPQDSFELLRAIYEIEREAFDARVAAFAERLGVVERLRVQLRQLSLGERMKMEIIGALLHEPEVVFLDEPTIGLDLVSRETIRSFLVEVNRERGVTIVLTSHDMEDIEETCRRLVILEAGRVIFDGDLVELLRHVHRERLVELHLEPGHGTQAAELEGLMSRFGGRIAREGPQSLSVLVPAEHAQPLIKALLDAVPVRDLSIERQPLSELVRRVFASGGMPGASDRELSEVPRG